jgi:uncharacterized membrane protein
MMFVVHELSRWLIATDPDGFRLAGLSLGVGAAVALFPAYLLLRMLGFVMREGEKQPG